MSPEPHRVSSVGLETQAAHDRLPSRASRRPLILQYVLEGFGSAA